MTVFYVYAIDPKTKKLAAFQFAEGSGYAAAIGAVKQEMKAPRALALVKG